ncbi:hypothetical protein J2S40_004511 [Nocardioides luteus]|nr:hypothetical protein [Nocardioides luteus]MDR7313453.1 hypothetical protein [Nocardioides luteus]
MPRRSYTRGRARHAHQLWSPAAIRALLDELHWMHDQRRRHTTEGRR